MSYVVLMDITLIDAFLIEDVNLFINSDHVCHNLAQNQQSDMM